MSGDRSAEFRASAADCLKLASRAGDPSIRAALLAMAQRWLDLADEPLGARRFQSLLEDFNSQQMLRQRSTGDRGAMAPPASSHHRRHDGSL
jgi:hypothetical protein